jgi:hypothetical protein
MTCPRLRLQGIAGAGRTTLFFGWLNDLHCSTATAEEASTMRPVLSR